MGDLISPGIQVKEKDLTTSVAAGATSVGAFAGIFEKGPISQVVIIDSEESLNEFLDTEPGRREKFDHNIFMIKF